MGLQRWRSIESDIFEGGEYQYSNSTVNTVSILLIVFQLLIVFARRASRRWQSWHDCYLYVKEAQTVSVYIQYSGPSSIPLTDVQSGSEKPI